MDSVLYIVHRVSIYGRNLDFAWIFSLCIYFECVNVRMSNSCHAMQCRSVACTTEIAIDLSDFCWFDPSFMLFCYCIGLSILIRFVPVSGCVLLCSFQMCTNLIYFRIKHMLSESVPIEWLMLVRGQFQSPTANKYEEFLRHSKLWFWVLFLLLYQKSETWIMLICIRRINSVRMDVHWGKFVIFQIEFNWIIR